MVALEKIEGPTHIVESGHQLRNNPKLFVA